MQDKFFLCQMRFYKYFWARKNKISLDEVDCEYIVLSRLENKKKPDSGCGGIQNIKLNSTKEEIYSSLKILAKTIENIHINKYFPKVKHIGNEFFGCMFCPFKGNNHPICNVDKNQYKQLLIKSK
jgi:hypothetical protein